MVPHARSGTSPLVGEVGRGASLILIALLLPLFLALITPALAREEIRSFTTAVTLLPNGTVDVTETIDVNVEGDQVRRGIFRDIPITLLNPDGSRLRSTLRVVSVTRDGQAEPWSEERIPWGTRIRIGDPDVLLPYRVHRYVIRYTMTRMARFFPDHDELYWNATGNYWPFPILSAVTSVTLPDGAIISELAAYTGRDGSTEQAATFTRVSDVRATFRSSRVLQPYEGMTVAVAFQKGIVAEPEGMQRIINWLSDHRDVVLPLFAVFIVLLYNYFAWDAVGRDPKKGTIIPLFHPPKDFSPALVEYVDGMGWRKNGWTAFTASIFNLGVKGLVMIDSLGKSLVVTATKDRPDEKLPTGEQLLYDFFKSKGKVIVNQTTGAEINSKRGALVAAIEAENRETWFRNNSAYAIFGFLLSVALLGALVFLGVLDIVWLVISIAIGVFLALFTAIFSAFWRGARFQTFIFIFWAVIAGANSLGGIAGWFKSFSIDTGLLAAISIVVINVVFAILLRAPTVQGRKVMDEIEGFKMYLDTAEKNRLNFQGEPQMTVTRFERILPYAIALGVEKPWTERFEGELQRHAVPDATGDSYSPSWYRGRDFSTGSGGFSNSVSTAATAMSAAMIAAQPSSSSGSGFSSGGGGGGSSGGGGGGGGGGGW